MVIRRLSTPLAPVLRPLRLAVLATALACSSGVRADVVTLADGVHADIGSHAVIAPDNRGEVANSGLIVGRRQMLAIDSGVSRAHGERLYEAWQARADRPFAGLLLSQPIQEFLFGAGAFRAHGVAVIAHRDAALLMRQRCDNCLTHLRELLPGGLMKGTALIVPDRLLDQATPIDLGDRVVELIDAGQATTPGTLAVFDPASGTLFAGGLIASQRIPSLRDARIPLWLAALEALRKRPITRIVPGFGPVGDLRQIDDMQRYLRQIDTAVRAEYQRGASLLETVAAVKLPAFATWKAYSELHPQNVQYLYRQFEDADFH